MRLCRHLEIPVERDDAEGTVPRREHLCQRFRLQLSTMNHTKLVYYIRTLRAAPMGLACAPWG